MGGVVEAVVLVLPQPQQYHDIRTRPLGKYSYNDSQPSD